MDKLCLNYFVDCFVSGFHDDLIQFVTDKCQSNVWFYAKHNTAKVHYHWYIEGEGIMNKLRTFVNRKKKTSSQRGAYALAVLKSTIVEYGSYVCYKPESCDVVMTGISTEDVSAMEKRRDEVMTVIGHDKKRGTVLDRLIRDCPYQNYGGDESQYNRMIDWLIDNRELNMFTRMKVKQLFMMWVMDWCKHNDIDRYKQFRHDSFKAMYDREVVDGHIKYYLAL